MDVSAVKKDAFYICGYCVETTAAQNDADISALYDDFFGSGKEGVLLALDGAKKGYCGLSWYTQGHEKYCYLLGIEVGPDNETPENAVIKQVPEAVFAAARFTRADDIMKAWNEFFYNEIPKRGWSVNGELNVYYEYYPESVSGDYELWVPVVNADV